MQKYQNNPYFLHNLGFRVSYRSKIVTIEQKLAHKHKMTDFLTPEGTVALHLPKMFYNLANQQISRTIAHSFPGSGGLGERNGENRAKYNRKPNQQT